ncbi:Fe-only nitrogenase accessory AnfO family protein [Acetobacterium paludosum]|nr:Fe-only nitrogenase accessory AnfO family protein [Acetobacterium paludosum]
MDIAVLVNASGKSSVFNENGIIKVYSKNTQGWNLTREKVYSIDHLENGNGLRDYMNEIGLWLNSCKVLVVKRIRGIHYLALEHFQISMLEIEGYPEEFLEYIQDCEKHQRTEEKVPLEAIAIFEQHPGYFYIDLQDVMSGKTSYNSKQILLPFFKEKAFTQLEIVCAHIPKWFEKELPLLGLKYNSGESGRCLKVQVSKV